MKPYGFIYLTTNLINGKIYIGQREFLNNKNGNANYLGSGTYFKRALQKYGKENFRRKILRVCFSQHELSVWEHVYIKKYHSQDPKIGYNIADGDVNTSEYNPSKSLEVRKKISQTLRRKFANGEIDRMIFSRKGKNHPMYGKHHSEESKKKNSESKKKSIAILGHPMKGKHCSEETKKKISIGNKRYANSHKKEMGDRIRQYLLTHEHPMKGKKQSEAARRKISEAAKLRYATKK